MPSDFKMPGAPASSLVGTFDPDEVERRAGVEPLAALLAERAELIEVVADLRAKFGSFGTFDHLRKVMLSQIKSKVRLEAMRDKRKVNNDQVDEEAHEDGDYYAFILDATKDRARWVRFEAKIEAIDYRINRGQALLRYISSEPR